MTMKARVVRNDFPRIARRGRRRASDAVRKATTDVRTHAAARSRVDTGTMRRGWQAVMRTELHGVVFNPVEYTIWNELGTRFMSAAPMATPAAELVRPAFVAAMRQAYR